MSCPRCGSVQISASGRCAKCGAMDSSSVTVLTPVTGAPAAYASSPVADPSAETTLADPNSYTPPANRMAGHVQLGPLTAGQAFGPRYHIIRALGAGGMGVVYQAWDDELQVAVALKVIRP